MLPFVMLHIECCDILYLLYRYVSFYELYCTVLSTNFVISKENILYACPFAWTNSAPNGWIFVKINMWGFFKNLPKKFKFCWNLTKTSGNLHEDVGTFFITASWMFLIKENISGNLKRTENIYFKFNNFFSENEVIWKYMLQPERDYRWQYNTKHKLCMAVD